MIDAEAEGAIILGDGHDREAPFRRRRFDDVSLQLPLDLGRLGLQCRVARATSSPASCSSTSSTWGKGPGGPAAGKARPSPGSRGRADVADHPSVGAVVSGLGPCVGSHRVPDTAPTTPSAAVAVVKAGAGSVSWAAPWSTCTTPVVNS